MNPRWLWLIIPAAIVVTVAALIGVALWLASKSDGRSRPSD